MLLVLFVFPEPMVARWPWEVSPLAARALLGWASVFSVVSLFFAVENRWSAARIAIESLVVWFGLLLLGFARAWDDADPTNPSSGSLSAASRSTSSASRGSTS